MATTDLCLEVQRPLAEYAWTLREKYGLNRGMKKKNFMHWYNLGEIELSTVYENLFVETRRHQGKLTSKISVNNYDFVEFCHKTMVSRPLGDMKIGVLKKNGHSRRFVISSVENKIGNIYFIGWNWMTNKPNFFTIPPQGGHPKCGYKIMVCTKTGQRTSGWYNDYCAYDTWEEMVNVDLVIPKSRYHI